MQNLNPEKIYALIQKYAPDDEFVNDYDALLAKDGFIWAEDWAVDMAMLDKRIAGVGMHWLVAHGCYPHAHSMYGDWDIVIRGLRYIPMDFRTPYPSEQTVAMVMNSIGSVEGCLKKLGEAVGLKGAQDVAMGKLLRHLKGSLGDELYRDVGELDKWLIVAKHLSEIPFDRRSRQHRFNLAEATGIYYASRLVGAQVLGRWNGLTEEYLRCAQRALADEQTLGFKMYYHRSDTPWSIINPNPTYR